jgi:hydrogenase maturation protease
MRCAATTPQASRSRAGCASTRCPRRSPCALSRARGSACWSSARARAIIIVDAIRSGAAPGTLHRIDAGAAPLPGGVRGSSSTHALGVAEAIELARTLGRLPRHVIVYGVEAQHAATGAGLSPPVSTALDDVTRAVAAEAERLATARA